MLDNYLVVAPYVRYELRPGLGYEPITFIQGKAYAVVNGVLRFIDNSNWNTYRIDVPDDIRTTLEYQGLINNTTAAIVFFDKSGGVISYITNIPMDTRSTTFAIPAGTAYVMAPVAGINTQTHFRLTFETVDLTAENSVMNWADTETLLSRDGMTAVFPEVIPEITIAAHSEGYRILQGLFRGSGMRAAARLAVYRRDNYDNDYTHVATVPLDFTTYNEAAESITISGVDASLNSLINSRGGTAYDIPVSELSRAVWNHTPLRLREWVGYTLPLDQSMTVRDIDPNEAYCLVSITQTESERLPGGMEYDLKGQQVAAGLDPGNYFAAVPSYLDTVARTWIRMKFTLRVETTYYIAAGPAAQVDAGLFLIRDGLTAEHERISINATTRSYQATTGAGTLVVTTYTEYTVDNAQEVPMASGVVYRLGLYWNKAADGNQHVKRRTHKMLFTSFEAFTIMWEPRSAMTPLPVSVVEPAALLQALLRKMQAGSSSYTSYSAEIVGSLDDRARIMLACGESLLRRPEAAFHCSLQDFREWMRTIGWEYEIDGSVLRYYPRDRVFSGACPIPLREEEVADLVITPDTSFAYTSLDIGYDAPDSDKAIGEVEPMGTATYSTGLIAGNSSVLELVSPFRADPVGIDLLIRRGFYEQPGGTGGDSAAKDIYAVALADDPAGGLTEYTGVVMRAPYPPALYFTVEGGVQPAPNIDLFNAVLHPRMLVERNKRYIGIAAPRIYYESSTGNDKVTFAGADAPEGITPQDTVAVDGYFRPQIYSFSVATQMPLPPKNARNSPLGFKWHGRSLAGYIKNIRRNVAGDKAVEWELWRYDGCE